MFLICDFSPSLNGVSFGSNLAFLFILCPPAFPVEGHCVKAIPQSGSRCQQRSHERGGVSPVASPSLSLRKFHPHS